MKNFSCYSGRTGHVLLKRMQLYCMYFLLLVGSSLGITQQVTAQSITSFSQFANTNDAWINGILQKNNSRYFEGTATLQRVVFVGIPSSTNTHTLTFNVLAAKKGINAYDYVTGFEQAFKDYEKIVGSDAGLTNNRTRLSLVKGAAVPNPADATIIERLYTGGGTSASINKGTAKVVDISLYRSQVQSVIGFYDGAYVGDRSIELYGEPTPGNGPTKITNVSFKFLGYTNEDEFGDTYGRYELKWTSTSPNIMILMSGHLAVGKFSKFPGLEYGQNLGASSISGGPYHFKLLQLQGATYTLSLGNQDNQIQSGAILPPPECNLSPGADLCVGEYQMHEALNAPATASFTWSLSGNGQFVSSTGVALGSTPTTRQVYVKGTGEGSYTIGLVVRDGGQNSELCQEEVPVYANPQLTNKSVDYCSDVFTAKNLSEFNTLIGAGNTDAVVWYSNAARLESQIVTSTGALAASETPYNFYARVTNGNNCSSDATLTIKILAAPTLASKVVDFCEDVQSNTTLSDYNSAIGAQSGDVVVWKDANGATVTTTGNLAVGDHVYTATVTRPYAETLSGSCDSDATLTIKILAAPALASKVVDFCEDVQSNTTLSDYNSAIGAQSGDVVVWKDANGATVTTTGNLTVGDHVYTATVTRPYAETLSGSCDSDAMLTIKILAAPALANKTQDYCEGEMVGVLLSSFNTSIGAQSGDVVVWKEGGNTVTSLGDLAAGQHVYTATVTRSYAETLSGSCDSDATLTITVHTCSKIKLQKFTDGAVDPTKTWSFTISGGAFGSNGVTETVENDADGILFESLVLSKDQTYTICETNVGSGFTVSIKYKNANGDWVDVPWYDPQTINGGGDFNQGEAIGNYCFTIGKDGIPLPLNTFGSTNLVSLMFEINNISPPGGNARTPGYWKNWNTCTNGKQAETAAKNGGKDEGFWLLDDHLPHVLWSNGSCSGSSIEFGSFIIKTCDQAVAILDERQYGGKGQKLANDAGYKLAKHLLAYQLNKRSGTYNCASAATAATQASALLAKYCFNGTASSYISNKGKANADYTKALELAKILDAYNNNLPCAPELSVASSVSSVVGIGNSEANNLKAYPTPFSDKATIEFTTNVDENYTVRLYDMKGALIKELKTGTAKAGAVNQVEVDGRNLPEGLYLARMLSDSGARTVKLLLKR